jgi:epsilon-lactone hydrolase
MSPSPQLLRLRESLRRQAAGPEVPVERQRADLNIAMAKMRAPVDVTCTSEVANGVPGEWIEPSQAQPGRVVLWLHGGGYSLGTLATARPLCSAVARSTRCMVYSVDYRLAPEHPMPAAVHDAVTTYRWLLDRGFPARSIAIGGDSAGGGLAAAMLIAARRERLPMPCAAIFLSPWADMTMSGASLHTNAESDPLFLPGQLEAMAARYLAGQDPRDALASPALADLAGFPPMLIHVSAVEALRDDSTALAKAAESVGVDVIVEYWQDVVHCWHAYAPVLPEANDALARMGEWLDSRWEPEIAMAGADG